MPEIISSAHASLKHPDKSALCFNGAWAEEMVLHFFSVLIKNKLVLLSVLVER